MAWVIRSEDRELFKSCRRAWDFGARERQNLEPRAPARRDGFAAALREALAVYYFPGMWSWERRIVQPLALAAFDRTFAGSSPRDISGKDVLIRYFDWARPLDRFTPIRVNAEFEVNVPDPERQDQSDPAERGLVAPSGEPVRFKGKIDLLMQDERDAYWLVEHRIVEDAVAERDFLLDEPSAANCWAWESFFLGMEIRGTIFNEIHLGPNVAEPFRRTVVFRDRDEIAARRVQFANEVMDMLDPALRVYPNPSAARCAACAFARPCVAMCGGADPRPFLVAEFRRRADGLAEPRLGAETWPTNRAAAVARFRGGGPSR